MPNLYHAAAGMGRLENLAIGDSVIHRLHPMAKLLTTIIFMMTVISFSSSNLSGLVPFLFYPIVLIALSGTPYRLLLGRLAIALPFSLAGGISNIMLMRTTAFYVGNFAVSYGALSCTSILLKTLLTVMAVLILIATTPFIEISSQLLRLRMPKMFCLQLIMSYRYISVLLNETVTMFTAYILRTKDGKGIQMKHMGSFLGQLLLRSFDRAERIYQAMKCRGFQGAYHGKNRSGLSIHDIAYTSTIIILMLILRFYNLSLFFGRLAG